MQDRQQLVFKVFLSIFEPLASLRELVWKKCRDGSVVGERLVDDAVGIVRGVKVRLDANLNLPLSSVLYIDGRQWSDPLIY